VGVVRRLNLLLALNLTVVSLLGLMLVDVAFVFWSLSALGRERVAALRVAAASAALAVAEAPDDAEAALVRVGAREQVDLTLVGRDGRVIATADPMPPAAVVVDQDHFVSGGYDAVAVSLPATSPFSQVIAALPLGSAASQVLSWQRSALVFFGLVAVVMVLLGLLFLRRVVVRPIARMTELVSRRDSAGLMQLGVEAPQGLSQLSQAIIAMTQRIEADREHIAAQLAQLTRAHADLRATQERLARAERLAVVGRLAAGLAHEIGNPLTVVIGFLEVIATAGLSDAERADALKSMGRELDRIHHTVRDMLDFSRAQARSGGVGEVGEVMEHVRRLLAPQERLRGVSLEVKPPESAVLVPLDATGLTQVLLNLLLNAADAVAGAGRICASACVDGTTVRIDIDDSGPGVPAELKARIFEPFFSTKPAGTGTGLGLAVCESVVAAAGGEIEVDRSGLGGARFSVTLPVARSRG
jgi:two-component system, NtrC family, sensor kinase